MVKNTLKIDEVKEIEPMVVSTKFKLVKEDLKKIAKGAGIAAAGAVATYILGALTTLDVGTYTPMVVAVSSIVCNAVLKFISTTKY